MAAGARVALVSCVAACTVVALAATAVAAGAEVAWRRLPQGFPAPVVPADNPVSAERVMLGEQLFGDRRLSVTGEHACVSCHDPVHAFTDRQPRSIGAQGQRLRRNAPSILYSAWNPSLGWDSPGSRSLESQMLIPLFASHPVELGLAGVEARVLALLQADASMRQRFEEAFPGERDPVTMDNVIRAIASFERTLGEGSSAFDRYVFEADRDGMSPSAMRGLDLFFGGQAGCSGCHSGMAFSGSLRSVEQPDAEPGFADNGHGTEGPARVPSLRNVAVTGPYMRDGALPTLAAVIDHYDRGSSGGMQPSSPPLPALHLTAEQKADLQAFLESLTDRPFEGLLSRP